MQLINKKTSFFKMPLIKYCLLGNYYMDFLDFFANKVIKYFIAKAVSFHIFLSVLQHKINSTRARVKVITNIIRSCRFAIRLLQMLLNVWDIVIDFESINLFL